MSNRFQVLAGQHIEPVGERGKKTYTKGQVVVSEKNLAQMFPFKFKTLGANEEPDEELAPAGAGDAGAGKPPKRPKANG